MPAKGEANPGCANCRENDDMPTCDEPETGTTTSAQARLRGGSDASRCTESSIVRLEPTQARLRKGKKTPECKKSDTEGGVPDHAIPASENMMPSHANNFDNKSASA